MIELELEYDVDVYQVVLFGEKSMDSFLEDLFNDSDPYSDNSAKSQICDLLTRHYSDYKGNPEIHDFEISVVQNDQEFKSGFVRFNYSVEFWFGCSGAKTHQDGYENIKFTINENATHFTLLFPEVEVRSTYEEF